MMIALVVLLLGIAGQQCLGTTLNCSSLYYRYPVDSDIMVNCGPSSIVLTINACPVQFAEFDPTSLALNGKHSKSNCIGALDTTVDPPAITFVFPLNDTTENTCGNSITIQDSVGTGLFQAFSSVQTVVIAGYVNTPDIIDNSLISYSTNLNYNFSCYYPLQYMLNNTELLTSSANVAINTNNGTFISTLRMQIFTDENLTIPLQSNGSALPLKMNLYVQVTATNLTANFNVHLDECFATPSPLMTTETASKFPLLSGCASANKTKILSNGVGKSAQFSFETFRFLQHSGQPTSSIYLHCATRLCQPDTCAKLQQACDIGLTTPALSRRKRAADAEITDGTTESVTVSSGPIYTREADISEINQLQGTLTGLIVGIIIAVLLGTALAIAGVILYKITRIRTQNDKHGVDNFTFSGK
ncbi:LOW QUALITY PROTEIN: zona pellucida-like domain-containing protein 1 [Bufo gargarizans]|uniref:LOW QUALITY PROTEIN: zona pellucida-like domain-containing protein 1 n=1 Tax=Bufo gargarizans TaxID=30331 RepID=UPI001CF2F121|nr:LOW QUALITY PROTEIN: zona pellucida-like domain-containing protein 1 [Bufo gargarizans]